MKKTILIISLAMLCAASYAQNTVSDSLGFESAYNADPSELLRGKISGVRVSSTDGNALGVHNVDIRGINTLHGDNRPLWIVDGVMLSNGLKENTEAFWTYEGQPYCPELSPMSFLDPSQIESIEVLKDASATSIYGTCGANGVIIVKSRLPKSGARQINLSSNLGVNLGEGTKKVSVGHNHRLSFSGERSKTAYNISGTFRDTEGLLGSNSGKAGSLNASFSSKANRKIWFGVNALLSAGKASTPSSVTRFGQPSMSLALRDPALCSTSLENWAKGYDDNSENFRTLTSAFLQLNFTPTFYMKLNGGFDLQYDRRILFYGAETEFGKKSDDNPNGGMASNLVSVLFNYNANLELGYNRYFAGDHHISFKLVGEALGKRNKYNSMSGYNFALDILRGKSLKVGTFDNVIRKIDYDYSHWGIYGVAEYDFKGVVGAELSYRADVSGKYGPQGWTFYPSASAWFDFAKAFIGKSKAVSSIKLGGGYGVSGKEDFAVYDLFPNYLTGDWPEPDYGTLAFYDGLNRLRTSEWHVGLSTEFLKGRIQASALWFDRKTEDKFSIFRMGSDTGDFVWKYGGCNTYYSRTANLINKGIEADLRAEIVKTKNFCWTLAANASFTENRVLSLNSEDVFGRNIGSGTFCNYNFTNLSAGRLCGYTTDQSGAIIDRNGDGEITKADIVDLGGTVPTCFGGLQTTLRYGGLSFELCLDGAAGHKVANINRMFKEGASLPEGEKCLTDKYVEKADYLRLGTAGLRYDFKLRASVLKGLAVRLSGHNLATLSSYSGWNPDVNCFGASARGIDYGSLPYSRSIILGVSVRF